MSYELSFTDAFFYPEEADLEIYDAPLTPKPTNLYDAICRWAALEPDEFIAVCHEAAINPEDMYAEWLLTDYARYAINTCTSLTSPVEVWLSKNMDYTVKVYDTHK